MQDEFYIGWEDRAPGQVAARVRRVVVGLLVLAAVAGLVCAAAQRSIGVSVFEWGKVTNFTGTFVSRPHPYLLVPRPGVRSARAAAGSAGWP